MASESKTKEQDNAEEIPENLLAKSSDQIRVQAEDFFSYYSNNLSVGISSWDVALIFGQIGGEREGRAVIEESVKILLYLKRA